MNDKLATTYLYIEAIPRAVKLWWWGALVGTLVCCGILLILIVALAVGGW